MQSNNKRKIGRPPPRWIIDLPKGDYFIEDILKFSCVTARTTERMMIKYGAKCEYVKMNRIKTLYHWEGFK